MSVVRTETTRLLQREAKVKKQKQTLFKFRVSNIEYGSLLRQELAAIEMTIGPFWVVKIRQGLFGNMTIWCKTKGA